jgi:A/G-specific adenine glycosylase
MPRARPTTLPFVSPLLRWFSRCGRDLPWRATRDPYAIWVSEIMLQQTQVDRVEDYYRRFLERFPTVHALSKARWPQVLAAWRGLGYYRRARNMMRAAKAVVAEHGGSFPATAATLEELPGIGPYTSRAVAVFAYEHDELVIDTNVARVLSRILGIESDDIPEKLMRQKDAIVPRGKAWVLHQALMDLGATICSAAAPACGSCPLRKVCRLRPKLEKSVRTREQRPSRATDLPLVDVAAGIVHRGGKILIARRPRGHLAGFWEFPGGKKEPRESWRACLKREIQEELGIEVAVRPHDWEEIHPYEDRAVRIRFHRCSILRGSPAAREGQKFKWVLPAELPRHRFAPADRRIIAEIATTRFVDPHG